MNNHLQILWEKLYSFWSELHLGIDTRGFVASPNQEGEHYTPLPYPLIFRMRKQLNMTTEDVFVDIGCGKGRVVCCMCQAPIKKVIAIELNAALLETTMANVRKLRNRRCPVEPMLKPAEDCDYDNSTIIYLYNPFNARLTELIVEKLFQSHSKFPRRMKVVYANPLYEEVFRKHNWLEKYDEWPAGAFPVFGCKVSFWRSTQENLKAKHGRSDVAIP